MSRKSKKETSQQKNWKKTAALFEDKKESLKIMKSSTLLTATEKRKLFGPGKTKQISVRLPEEDIEAVKEIAEVNNRPYQQLVAVAVQQFLDRVLESNNKKKAS